MEENPLRPSSRTLGACLGPAQCRFRSFHDLDDCVRSIWIPGSLGKNDSRLELPDRRRAVAGQDGQGNFIRQALGHLITPATLPAARSAVSSYA